MFETPITITVPNDKPCKIIISMKVNIDITHSEIKGLYLYFGGLKLYTGTCDGTDLTVTFDDNSADAICCPAGTTNKWTGTFQPATALSTFSGSQAEVTKGLDAACG